MITLLSAATGTGAGSSSVIPIYTGGNGVVQVVLSNTTTPTATVDVEVSLDGTNWVVFHTFSLTTAGESQGVQVNEPWVYIRANVTAISGTSASVDAYSNWSER